jgi:hypothetical protein
VRSSIAAMSPPQAASTDRHANTLGDILEVRADAGTEVRR